jgi:peptidoglycan/xylan/chitin deacetylase (PgdA/CDA1 family)
MTNPTYPAGTNPNDPIVCSATYKCKHPDDIWDAPDGYVGISFDDGPTEFSPPLTAFLRDNKQPATHFVIGRAILGNPTNFLEILGTEGQDIACHTWNHPYLTTLSNTDLLAQFGWTMEIIRVSSGGLVPRYLRPPFGDIDNRVRAVAKEVFGLETVIWNQDAEDWSINTKGGITQETYAKSMTGWLTGPKSPGLMVLEHESSAATVQAFISNYPQIKANGWKSGSVVQIISDKGAYQGGPPSNADVPSPQPDPTTTASTSTKSPITSAALVNIAATSANAAAAAAKTIVNGCTSTGVSATLIIVALTAFGLFV